MTTPQIDDRSAEQRARDEAIAEEAMMDAPDLPAKASGVPVEQHLEQIRRPVAVAGVVENGLVRPLDPSIRLPEEARVIIVAKGSTSQ